MLKVDGVEKRFYGTLLVVLADTLAAHDLGGFKSGVGRALRKCRQCMATGEDIQSKVSTFLAYICTRTSSIVPMEQVQSESKYG